MSEQRPPSSTSDEPHKRRRLRAVRARLNTAWSKIERNLGAALPLTPSLWSWAKLLVCSPLIALGVWGHLSSSGAEVGAISPRIVFWTFSLSLLFDVCRRSRLTALVDAELESALTYDSETKLSIDQLAEEAMNAKQRLQSAWINRLCDLPLSCFLTYTLTTMHPVLSSDLTSHLGLVLILWSKVVLELITSLLMMIGRGPQRTRLRTMTSELSLYVLIALNLGFNPKLLTLESAVLLVGFQVCFSVLVLAYQLRILQKRFIADTLSGLNFICGLISIHYSLRMEFDTSLLFLLLGGAFDGFDGAAARKFGGTRFGVYSDDIADGMNYGIAPAFAVYALMGGLEGLIIGAFYAIFTISRLVYFTLNKEQGDPSYFAGIPSPVGGMIVMSSVVLFTDKPLWVSFLVGVSSTLMVSFKTPYVHIFRGLSWRSKNLKRQALIGTPLFLASFLSVTLFWGTSGAAAVILAGACAYGFIPSILSFYFAIFSPKLVIAEDD